MKPRGGTPPSVPQALHHALDQGLEAVGRDRLGDDRVDHLPRRLAGSGDAVGKQDDERFPAGRRLPLRGEAFQHALAFPVVRAAVEDDGARQDPLRLIEAVTAGVAFLAAGTIIVARGRIKGLTTGAGLWLAGAIGLAAGLGFWQIAAFATFLAVIVLGLLHPLEKVVPNRDEDRREPD